MVLSAGSSGSEIQFDELNPSFLFAGGDYVLRFSLIEGEQIEIVDPLRLRMIKDDEQIQETLSISRQYILLEGEQVSTSITSHSTGSIKSILLPYVTFMNPDRTQIQMDVVVYSTPDSNDVLTRGSYNANFETTSEGPIVVSLENKLEVEPDTAYFVQLQLNEGSGIQLRGSRIISETSWDLGLPLRVDGRDGFGGLYSGLNQELYWDDDSDSDRDGVPDKLNRIMSTLTRGDYLVIPTNRVYGTTTRAPERYPLTTAYYRALFGCPAQQQVLDCAARADPGEVVGELGYRLVATYASNPTLGGVQLNDQYAEEAFTVYDHPKVLIFAKEVHYSESGVYDQLGDVDVRYVVHAPPRDLGQVQDTILLSPDDFENAQDGGTWSDLFDRENLINRFPALTILIWWIAIGGLGLVAFPIVRIAFRGLHDRGYSIARLLGMLLIAWGTWIMGSLKVPVEKPLIFMVFMIVGGISAWLAWRDRQEIIAFIRENKKTILWTELLALAFFALDLAIRIGNPDLWHPFKGGEKPMDFSYLNAVLKSTSFPPFDPWFAQGYINYYYFGFVLVGMPIKLLGIVPSTAYNLVIPTLFSLVGLSAYCVGYNLFRGTRRETIPKINQKARMAGIAAAVALVLLGNLGTLRMFYEGFRDVGGWPGESEASFGSGPVHALQGFVDVVLGNESLTYRIDNWYWDPSRAIEPEPGEAGPITEFPFFTFLYADLHAHMINLPLTVAVLAWGVSWILSSKDKRSLGKLLAGLFVGALLLGALRPTNAWDFPTYWVIAGLAVLVSPWIRFGKVEWRAILEAGISLLFIFGAAYLLYQPYNIWYQQGYTAADLWQGSQTSLGDYITVHGLFLFMILTWLAWETREWMARTPLQALAGWRRTVWLVLVFGLVLVGVVSFATFRGFGAAPLAALVLVWSGLLLLKGRLPLAKMIVLFWVGTGAALTVGVEFIVLRGDISRMNTVFKFYLQVWTLFSISAAVAMAWIRVDLRRWGSAWRNGWWIAAAFLIIAAFLYPISAAPAKMRDRMSDDAPISLDGMAYMQFSTYNDIAGAMPLGEDFEAITWMQENVIGSPVIVEANTPEYRWGSRFTIYTGLPGVLGWNWHQRQQRGFGEGPSVVQRANDIAAFYTTRSTEAAVDFLTMYKIKYVIVGQLEKQYYASVQPCFDQGSDEVFCELAGWPMGMPEPGVKPTECRPYGSNPDSGSLTCPTYGLEKFGTMVGLGYLREAFRLGETVIYEVIL
jgi:YYY domain-containing protein